MPRLLDWPAGLMYRTRTVISGPRSIRAGSSESSTGYVQSVASPFGLWRIQFTFPPKKGKAARAMNGLITALHGGANAVRVPIYDPDQLGYQDLGINVADDDPQVDWGETELPWSDLGLQWRLGYPPLDIEAAAAKGATQIEVDATSWGAEIDLGTMLGMEPSHFGAYVVTEVITPGTLRIWPPLRKAITTSNKANLTPTLAMRLMGEGDATISRELGTTSEASLTLTEVEPDTIDEYFSG